MKKIPNSNQKLELPSTLADLLKENAKDRERVAEYFYGESCKYIRKLVIELAEKRIHDSISRSDHPGRFKDSNYTALQAGESGYRRAYREILNLLDR